MNHHTMTCKWCEQAARARHLRRQTSPLSAFRKTAPPHSIHFCCHCQQSYRRLLSSKPCRSHFHVYKPMLSDIIGQRFTSHVSASILQPQPATARQMQSKYMASMEELQWTCFSIYPSYKETHFCDYLMVKFCVDRGEIITRPFSTAWAQDRTQQCSSGSSPSWCQATPNLSLSSAFSESTSGDVNESTQFGGWQGCLKLYLPSINISL